MNKKKPDVVLRHIKKFYIKNGYPPSVRQLCKEFKYKSTATMFRYIDILKDRGDIIPCGKTYTVKGIHISFDEMP